MKKIINFFKKEDGQGMVEYGLIIALVAIVLIVGIGWVTGGLEATFDTISTSLGGVGDGV